MLMGIGVDKRKPAGSGERAGRRGCRSQRIDARRARHPNGRLGLRFSESLFLSKNSSAVIGSGSRSFGSPPTPLPRSQSRISFAVKTDRFGQYRGLSASLLSGSSSPELNARFRRCHILISFRIRTPWPTCMFGQRDRFSKRASITRPQMRISSATSPRLKKRLRFAIRLRDSADRRTPSFFLSGVAISYPRCGRVRRLMSVQGSGFFALQKSPPGCASALFISAEVARVIDSFPSRSCRASALGTRPATPFETWLALLFLF